MTTDEPGQITADVLSKGLDGASSVIVTGGKINDDDVHALLDIETITSLDLGGTSIDAIKGNYDGMTFSRTGSNENTTLTSLVFPKCDGSTIPDHVIVKLTGLKNLTIPDGYAEVGQDAFIGLSQVESVILGDGITKIGENAFGVNEQLTFVDLPKTLKEIGKSAFFKCGFETISFPDGLETIRERAFSNNKELKTIVFPASINRIEDKVFETCEKLSDIYFLGLKAPDYVGDEVFSGATYDGYNTTGVWGNTNGTATRYDYGNFPDNVCGMLHLNPNMPQEERNKFTDPTRKYSLTDAVTGEEGKWPNSDEYTKTKGNLDSTTSLCQDGTPISTYGGVLSLYKFMLVAFDATAESAQTWDFSKYQSDKWWTIMVPFNMARAQVKEVFGENTEVCRFSKVERNETAKTIKLKFTDEVCQTSGSESDVVMEGFVSYMIHPSGEGTFSLRNYDPVTGGYPVETRVQADDGSWYIFIGNYVEDATETKASAVAMPQYSYFLGAASDGSHKLFFQTGTNGQWNQWTAIVRKVTGDSSEWNYSGVDDYNAFFTTPGASNATIFTSFGSNGGETTAIYNVNVEAGAGNMQNCGVYNISGQKISDNANLNNLPKGMYIVNGKKYIIK